MKLTKLLLLGCLSFFIYSCSDKDDPKIEPPVEAEKQISEVISVLKEDSDLSTFREALSDIDAKVLTDKEFTILAYKNQSTAKARSVKNTSDKQQETMRHIIGGRYTFEELSKIKKLVALSKDTLYIEYSASDNSISINGVLIGKSMVADKSIIFVADKMIPQVEDETDVEERMYLFKVMNINANWASDGAETSGIVEGASISIYEDENVIKELTTDANGLAPFSTSKEDANLTYVAKTDTSSMFYQGYLVVGLFTTQEQADSAPIQKDFKAVPGGLRFADINGDGIIDDKDKIDRAELKNISEDMIIYLVGESYTFPKEEVVDEKVSWEMLNSAYSKHIDIFNTVDNDYSSLAQRQGLSATSKIVDSLWNSSYDLIIKVNKKLTEGVAGEQNQLLTYRSQAYFNLVTAFGGVPLQLENSLDLKLSRSTSKEVYNQIAHDLEQVFGSSADSIKYKSETYIRLLNVFRVQKNYNTVYAKSKEAIDRGTIKLSADSGATALPILHVYLIAAESANELGNTVEAAQYVNQLLAADKKASLSTNSKEEIRSVIQNYYIGRNEGLKYINIQSWDLNNTWSDQYKLLPIPSEVINVYNGNVSQNSGY